MGTTSIPSLPCRSGRRDRCDGVGCVGAVDGWLLMSSCAGVVVIVVLVVLVLVL